VIFRQISSPKLYILHTVNFAYLFTIAFDPRDRCVLFRERDVVRVVGEITGVNKPMGQTNFRRLSGTKTTYDNDSIMSFEWNN
jgi:hypothetical protein